jgi:hypothetical protein
MAKTKASNSSTTLGLNDRILLVNRLASQLQREVEALTQDYTELTGNILQAFNASPASRQTPTASVATKTKGRRRTRHPSPDIAWLEKTLSKKGMTVKQLQKAAADENLSGLKIAAMLNGSKSKFKAEQGKKDEGKKGKPAMVWGVKG